MSGFQIAQAHVLIQGELDEGSVEESTGSMKGKLVGWAAALGLGALISKGITDTLNISAANTKLAAQMGLTSATAKKAGDAAGSVYKDGFGESIDDVNTAIKGVGQNMVNLKDISKPQLQELTEGALGISDAFDVDVNDSTRAAGQLMKTGLAKDGKQALDIITKGFQMGMDSSGDWLDTLNEYSPQFAKIGIDGPQALNLVNQMMKAGARDSDSAADAIKEFGLRAIDTSEATTEAYKGLNLNADKMRKTISEGGPAGAKAMQQVFDALQKVKDPVKQNQLGTALMGTQWEDTVRAILPKINLTKDSVGKVAGATDKMNQKLGSTPQAKIESFKRSMEMMATGVLGRVVIPMAIRVGKSLKESFGPPLKIAGEAAKKLFDAMGGGKGVMSGLEKALKIVGKVLADTLVPAITKIIQGMTKVVEFVKKWQDVLIPLGAGIAAFTLVVNAQRIATALWTAITKGASFATKAWAAAQAAMNFVMAANPIVLVIAVIVALVVAIVVAYKKSETFRAIVQACWEGIKTAISTAWEFIKGVFSSIADFFTKTIPGWVQTLQDKFHDGWNAIKKATKAVWDWIKDFITTRINNAKTNISNVVGAIKDKISTVWNGIKSVTTTVWNAIKDFITTRINNAKTNITNVVNAIRDKVSSIWNGIKNTTKAAWDWIKSKITGGINAARDAVSHAVGKISSTVSGIKGKVMSALSGAASWLKESGKKIIQGLIDGIMNMAGKVKDAVKGVLSSARDLLPFSPAKEGPFSGRGWTLYSGRSIMTGLAEGITDEAPSVHKSMTSALSRAQGQVQTTVPSLATTAASGTSYGDIYVTIPARDLAEMAAVRDFFTKIQQTARAGQNKRAVKVTR